MLDLMTTFEFSDNSKLCYQVYSLSDKQNRTGYNAVQGITSNETLQRCKIVGD